MALSNALTRLVLAIACVAFVCSAANAEPVVKYPDGDAMIFGKPSRVDDNWGAEYKLMVGWDDWNEEGRSLMYFDLSAYSGQEVAAPGGTLSLRVIQEYDGYPGTMIGHNVDVYLIDASEAGWDEMSVTWRSQENGVKLWTGGVGLGAPGGGSYGATPIASLTITDDSWGTWWDFAIPKAVLDDWISNPGGNYGILVRDRVVPSFPISLQGVALGAHDIDPEKGVDEADWPRLTCDVVPEPSSLALLVTLGVSLAACGWRWRRRG